MRISSDTVAVVSGAGSGIGRATAIRLAERGATVAVADRNADGADATVLAIESAGGRAQAFDVDVSQWQSVADLAASVEQAFGNAHVVVNNAGVTCAGAFEQDSPEDQDWIVGINVWGVVYGCRAFLPQLRSRGHGHIVNLSSMVGLIGLPHNAIYSLTKGAVRSFSEGLRSELITADIGVTTVFPGAINTGITQSARGAEASRLASMGQHRFASVAMRPPSAVAKRIVHAIEHNRPRVIVGPDAHLASLISRALPGRSGLIGRATSRLTDASH